MKKLAPKKVVIIGIVLLLISVMSLVLINSRSSSAPEGYRRGEDFVYHKPNADGLSVGCEAIIPSCGYCLGKIINEICYVKK